MADVTDLSAYRRSNNPDGTAHLACPECGNVWWRSPGVVLEVTDDDAAIHSVAGFAHPLTCVECDWTAPTPRPVGC